MTPSPPRLDTIDHVHVFVADRAAARRWYEDVLGLKVMPEFEFWAADGGPLTLANAAGNIHIALFERAPLKNRSTIALGVGATDFLAWRTHLQACFGKPTEAVDHQLSWSLYFADPDGNPYEITTYEHAEVQRALASA